jgi:hypothetical protein
VVPDWPETAKFLRPIEREILVSRLAEDSSNVSMNQWDKKTAQRIFGDIKIWFGYAYHSTLSRRF